MALEVKRINKSFGFGDKKERIIHNFSMTVEDGEMVAVVGKKCTGKSTLMNILSGMQSPDSGTMTVDGVKIRFWDPFQTARLRARTIGVVTRDAVLIQDMTIYENLMVPMGHVFMSGKKKLRRAKEVLKSVGLKGKGKWYPEELEEFEIQKVCLARAIMTKPKYLIFDEPTGGLQSADVDRFMDLLEILNGSGFTVIVLTHSRRVAAHCQRLIPIVDTTEENNGRTEDEKEYRKLTGHTLVGSKNESEEEPRRERPQSSAAGESDIEERLPNKTYRTEQAVRQDAPVKSNLSAKEDLVVTAEDSFDNTVAKAPEAAAERAQMPVKSQKKSGSTGKKTGNKQNGKSGKKGNAAKTGKSASVKQPLSTKEKERISAEKYERGEAEDDEDAYE